MHSSIQGFLMSEAIVGALNGQDAMGKDHNVLGILIYKWIGIYFKEKE